MNNTNSLVWYKFLGNLRPEEKRMQLARVFFFSGEKQNFVYRKELGRRLLLPDKSRYDLMVKINKKA